MEWIKKTERVAPKDDIDEDAAADDDTGSDNYGDGNGGRGDAGYGWAIIEERKQEGLAKGEMDWTMYWIFVDFDRFDERTNKWVNSVRPTGHVWLYFLIKIWTQVKKKNSIMI